jgi:hypothetical protein
MQSSTPNAKLWQLVLGFANTNVLYALTKSGVIEQLRNAPKDLRYLADTCDLDSDVLFRTLRFAMAVDIVSVENGNYRLTETGKLLLKDVPGSLYGGLMLIGAEPWQKCWNNLYYSLQSGKEAFNKAMGSPIFDYLDAHPEYGEPYNQWMTTATSMAVKTIAASYDFTPFQRICDIGGGQGILLKTILSANPHLEGILYDQESVVKHHVLNDVRNRVQIQTGNFFEEVPAADVLIMKSVLHDWDDSKSLQLLQNCKKVMTSASRLLIVDMVLGNEPNQIGAFYDLHMQVLLEGRERTEEEFEVLLHHAGLQLLQIIPTQSPLKIIEVALP